MTTTPDTPTPASADGPAADGRGSFMHVVRAACATPAGRSDMRRGLNIVLADLEHPTGNSGQSRWPLYTHLMAAGYRPPATAAAELPHLLVAALYAVYDAPNPRMSSTTTLPAPALFKPWHNLGWSFATAAHRGVMNQDNATGTLGYLAELDQTTLLREIPAVVARLRSASIPITWTLLLADLLRWRDQSAQVRLDWARAFHNTRSNEETSK
ncbi:type I-E CRISPR-associated protein Cse2/CasB [Streptomyces sp. NPDC090077]|uniref:type I-E CRISPR-associated protein Cse2/CasB n=1 Tax=Streptomyces sp. NPDC090077 TaxID=3365938 RepID=UPI00380DAC7F